ncbi:MAG: HDOD domain-containing protein [Verrucomicrobia bacterium]|nr:HDOD domain-containing protein [Verrucomicrobiota bacterium]
MDVGRKRDFAEAVNYVEDLYPNMAVLSQLANYLDDPNSSLDNVVGLIRAEPALTVDIIKISNSSFYASTQKCSDVDTALTRIGFNEVLRVVALILAKELCSSDLEKYGVTADDLWTESLMVSLLMEEFARDSKMNKSKAATLGILHCIGRVVINNILEDFRVDIYWDPTIPVVDWEEAVVGFHYGEAGGRLLKKLEFPTEALQVIRYHVNPKEASKPDRMTYLLNYSVNLSNVVGRGFINSSYELPDDEYLAKVGEFSEKAIREIVKTAQDRFLEVTNEVFAQ